jgi:hypothetical protein
VGPSNGLAYAMSSPSATTGGGLGSSPVSSHVMSISIHLLPNFVASPWLQSSCWSSELRGVLEGDTRLAAQSAAEIISTVVG